MHGKGKRELYNASDSATPSLVSESPPVSVQISENDGKIWYHGDLYQYNEDILTFLIMGIDSRDVLPKPEEVHDYTLGGQADMLFLAVVNPHTRQINLISVNRNAMGEVEVYDPDNQYIHTDLLQVCLQHGYGSGLQDSCERQVKTVSVLFYDLPIHGYLAVNLGAVSELNDEVGGVEVTVLENIPTGSEELKNGLGKTVTLYGKDAYCYVQYRDITVFDSASQRMERQKQYLSALTKIIKERTKKNITYPLQILDKISPYTVTDISISEISYMATTYLGYEIAFDSIYSLQGETVTGAGGFEEFYIDDEALYDLIIDLFYEKVFF